MGASIYFNWLETKLRAPEPLRSGVDGEAWMGHGGAFYRVEKHRVQPGQVPRPVYWFRVEAGVTWLSGFLLLVLLYCWTGGVDLVDPKTTSLSPATAVALVCALLIAGWQVYDLIWVSRLAEAGARFATALSLIILVVLVYGLCELFTGRAAFILVGSILGTNMVANVWMRIVPAQEEAVTATAAGRERNAALGARARRRAMHNTYMMLPVLFTMVANHAPIAYTHDKNWLILLLLIGAGVGLRHLMIMRDRQQPARLAWGSVVVAVAALAFLSNTPHRQSTPPAIVAGTATSHIPFTVVRGIVELRCGSCHSQTPREEGIRAAPNGLGFDTPGEITTRASVIRQSVLVSRTMPPGNRTGMTEEERALLGRWISDGALMD